MSVFCPFCLSEHGGKKCEIVHKVTRTKQQFTIPQEYIDSVRRGATVYPITVVGYSTCGKTAFLSSLMYSLYQIPDTAKWKPPLYLNQSTINKIRDKYITVMTKNREFPPSTSEFFEEPLLVKVTFPHKGLLNRKIEKSAILVMYDVKGGTYDTVDNVIENFPLISRIPNLLILVDIYKIYEESGGAALDIMLHSLINQIYISLTELGDNPKLKNIIVCFTKIDKLKGNEDFAPLSFIQNFTGYDFVKNSNEGIINISMEIEEKLFKKKWKRSLGIINENFGGYLFVGSSAVGKPPVIENGIERIEQYSPTRVIDPILWLLTYFG